MFICLFAGAQNQHGDCASAMKLGEDSYSAGEIKGFGEILEISGNELGNDRYFTEEHNTMWFSYTAPYDGDLTFEIKGGDIEEDWDFLLFEATPTQCDDIKSKTLPPIRTNLARNDADGQTSTGLSATATDEFVAAGVNNNMSKWLSVEEGKNYLLVIDNSKGENNGFELNIHLAPVEREINIEKEQMVEDDGGGFEFVDMSDPGDSEMIIMHFEIRMEGSDEPVTCNAEVLGTEFDAEVQTFEETSSFSVEVPKDKYFFINVEKNGYTFSAEKLKATEENAEKTQVISISRVEAGKSIVLTEIVFRENTTQLLPTSRNALEQLIRFMNENTNARIEVQGHVNAPGYDNEGRVKRFSLKRAEAVKEYLVDNGIDGRRIEVAGMGNEFMVYPNPKNYDQEKANRRVEIKILSL